MRCPQLINLQCFQLTISSSQNLKKVIFVLHYRSDFYSVLARMLVKKWAKSHYFQSSSSSVLSVFGCKTCILHHFAFLVWLPARIFKSPITRFLPPKSHFLATILLFSVMFFMLHKGFVYTIAAYIYAFCFAFSGTLPCILHHFTLRLAPKRIAFSTKTHCVQHQNTLYLASKRTTFSSKQPKNRCK